MKTKKLLAGILSAAMVFSSMALPVFAEDTYVAQVGATNYTDLNQALEAAKNGDTFVLLSPVTVPEEQSGMITVGSDETGEKYVFDFNGNKLTGGIFNMGADVTIKNGNCAETRAYQAEAGQSVMAAAIYACAGTTVVETGSFDSTNAVVVAQGGDVTLNDGTYVLNSTREGYGIYPVVNVTTRSTVTINGGTYKMAENKYGAPIAVEDGSVTINDGKFYSNDFISVFAHAEDSEDDAKIEINRGVFDGGVIADPGSDITINGGEFSASNLSVVKVYNDNEELKAGKVTITGGTFNGKVEAEEGAKLTIYGGTFDTDVSPYLADGYILKVNDDKTYTAVNEDVINVTAVTAQDYLDGKYGDITGKTINFTENIDTILDLARPTKYKGSNTTYYKWLNGVWDTNATPWSENISTEMTGASKYVRALNNVTFTANEGVKIAGFTFSAGHAHTAGMDYVRGVETGNGVTYYRYSSMNHITFKGLTITQNIDLATSLDECSIDNITFDGCTFVGNDSYQGHLDSNGKLVDTVQAIRVYSEASHNKNITVKDCTIDNYYQGMFIDGIDSATITGNYVSNTAHNSLALQSVCATNYVAGTITVEDNYFSNAADRAIRFGNVSNGTSITVNDNVMVNCGDGDGQLIKAGSLGDGCQINLDYNYWSGKDASTAVDSGLSVIPAKTGVNEGVWNKEITDAYVTNGKKAQNNNDNTWTVVDAEATVIETAKTTGATVTLNDLHAQSEIDLGADATYKLVVATAPQADVEKANKKIAEEETGESKNTSKQIFDISVYKTDSHGTSKDVSSAISQQQVTITLGETPKEDTVKVYHVGSTETEKINSVTVKGNTITFTAPSFSTYAVTYTAETPTNITDKVGVVFSKVDSTSNEYYINLKALKEADTTGNASVINRFMSADLVFKNNCATVDYEIEPAANMTAELVSTTDNSREYRFAMDGIINSCATGEGITIGKVVFSGYGTLDFSVDNGYTLTSTNINEVHTAEIADNIVDTYKNETLIINDAATHEAYNATIAEDENGTITDEIKKETANLTINIDFPNAIVDQTKDYQDMTVTISGGDLTDDVVYELGTDGTALNADGKYVINVADTLTKNVAYTVKVEGAGYRTARYTVNMTGAKTLNFWNNVKDTAINVEEGVGTAKNTTFLAGDIVKDNQINIYDLSAVVSYFGTDDLVSEHPEYAKYDLNRDGKIDSKDIAYVLVSWNN